jgi:chromosomal replication initiation ATPase DnaA
LSGLTKENIRLTTLAPRQLALALNHTESFAREDFLSGPSNAAALAVIESWPQWPNPAIVLTGPEGSGKSHLAAVWSNMAGARLVAARALDPAAVPATLATGALVIEDAAADAFDERALFHLLNLAREQQDYLLLTARTPPAAWSFAIRDLGSRLRALPSVTLAPPDDTLLRAVLVKLFADRQIAVEESLVSYVLTRIERSFAAARKVVQELDAEAMRRKRALTRALAAEILRERGGFDGRAGTGASRP